MLTRITIAAGTLGAGAPDMVLDAGAADAGALAGRPTPSDATANEASAATPTVPPMKRRRDQRCALVSVTIFGRPKAVSCLREYAADGRPGGPARRVGGTSLAERAAGTIFDTRHRARLSKK